MNRDRDTEVRDALGYLFVWLAYLVAVALFVGCADDYQEQNCGTVLVGAGGSITGPFTIDCGDQDQDNAPGNALDIGLGAPGEGTAFELVPVPRSGAEAGPDQPPGRGAPNVGIVYAPDRATASAFALSIQGQSPPYAITVYGGGLNTAIRIDGYVVEAEGRGAYLNPVTGAGTYLWVVEDAAGRETTGQAVLVS